MRSIDDFIQSVRTDYKIPMLYFLDCVLLDKLTTFYIMQKYSWAENAEHSPFFNYLTNFISKEPTIVLAGLTQLAALGGAVYIAHKCQNKNLAKRVIYGTGALTSFFSLLNALQL